MQVLTAIPIFNEERHLEGVLHEVRRYCSDILVIDDGSTDRTPELLARQEGLRIVTHPQNRGYGAALISAFEYVKQHPFDVLVTIDCDGQHQPARIPLLTELIGDADIVSGSRYLREFRQDTVPPEDRRFINQTITQELNERFGLHITDAFCGFKAYRTSVLERFRITETGWGMPLELWVQAARLEVRIKEVGVPRVYLDLNRSFGAGLDDSSERLAYYRRVIAAAEAAFPAPTGTSLSVPCCCFDDTTKGSCL
jgi:glycosyltransferase involved in cell wall biosynthesis